MLRITNLRIPVGDEQPLSVLAARRLRLPAGAVRGASIVRRAIDARRKNNIAFVYTLDVDTEPAPGTVLARLGRDKDVALSVIRVMEPVVPGSELLSAPPVVVGFGPAGMLAGLTLAEAGYRPLVLERGRPVEERSRDVAAFWRTGCLDEESNVQFGEGGAGTFSDGKLTTRVNDPRMADVLALFIRAGAPPEIAYEHKPHVGTDRLKGVVRWIRKRILSLGGTVRFESRVTDLATEAGKVTGVRINAETLVPAGVVLLAIGNSARDTYGMLAALGVPAEVKPFAVGVRIEHPQELIDQSQYGPMAGHPRLGPADYSLVYHNRAAGRTCYSFCMCPGGEVIAASSEAGGVVTNGMSLYRRSSGTANSALVVNVGPADFGPGILAGIAFQRQLERQAFAAGGGGFLAPFQSVGSFLGRGSGELLAPSYRPGTKETDLRCVLPSFVAETLALAIPDFDRRIRGFAHAGAVLTAVETRTSAPVRLLRGDLFESPGLAGLYPAGEGAGYAGGIMSAALDGLAAAHAVIRRYRPH